MNAWLGRGELTFEQTAQALRFFRSKCFGTRGIELIASIHRDEMNMNVRDSKSLDCDRDTLS